MLNFESYFLQGASAGDMKVTVASITRLADDQAEQFMFNHYFGLILFEIIEQ